MDSVTYILGAGASFPTLPLNNGLISYIKALVTLGNNHPRDEIEQTYLSFFQNNFLPLIEEAEQEVSIDTLANMYFGDKRLHHIKALLWMFFSSRAGFGKVDPRYKNLLLKIGKKRPNAYHIEKSVNFLSWNYDLQLEEAFALLDNTDIWRVPKKMYSFPGVRYTDPNIINSNPEAFRLVHLNGCAGFYYNQQANCYNNWYRCDLTDVTQYNELLSLVCRQFYTNTPAPSALNNCINFVGEGNSFSKETINHAKRIAENTTHLVIIGYSLPDFNREVDREIINSMTRLKYVCIQDPNALYLSARLINGFNSIGLKQVTENLKVHTDINLGEFHVPHDL